MKLEDVKSQIDKYFENINPNKLYKILRKYGFKRLKNNTARRNGMVSRR